MDKLGRGKEPSISAADRGEMVTVMEPLVLSEGSRHRAALADLAIDLAAKSASFRRSLPASLLTSPATLVRSVNCHYSNLIEGHDSHPVDIERALCEDYSLDARKRDLQTEARAHIAVPRWIDEGGLQGKSVTVDGLVTIHRRFCELLPEDLLWVEDPATEERLPVIAGELRRRDVKVGAHLAISPGAVLRFLARYQQAYGSG